jgi:hypothetical protein
VDAPAAEFDEEEHVQPLQRDRLDRGKSPRNTRSAIVSCGRLA